MKLKSSAQDWRSVVNDLQEEVFYFTGRYYQDLQDILTKVNYFYQLIHSEEIRNYKEKV